MLVKKCIISLMLIVTYSQESLMAMTLGQNQANLDVTDFFIAVAGSDADEIIRMLDLGLDINTTALPGAHSIGETALQRAACDGNCAIVQLLLDRNADVNHQNDSGRTALMYAVGSDSYEVVDLLISAGADVNLIDTDGNKACNLLDEEDESFREERYKIRQLLESLQSTEYVLK